MSTYIVNNGHVDLLVTAWVEWDCCADAPDLEPDPLPDQVGALLLRENLAAVDERYEGRLEADEIGAGLDYTWRRVPYTHMHVVDILKAVNCYRYQACESPSWQRSSARAVTGAITQAGVRRLPGYDDAQWEWTREEAERRLAEKRAEIASRFTSRQHPASADGVIV